MRHCFSMIHTRVYSRPRLCSILTTLFGPSSSLIFCEEQFRFQGAHYDCYNSAHQTPVPITFTFVLSNYRSRLLFQEESELSSKRWASAPRRPDSPCVLGAPTSREVSPSRSYFRKMHLSNPDISVNHRLLEEFPAQAKRERTKTHESTLFCRVATFVRIVTLHVTVAFRRYIFGP